MLTGLAPHPSSDEPSTAMPALSAPARFISARRVTPSAPFGGSTRSSLGRARAWARQVVGQYLSPGMPGGQADESKIPGGLNLFHGKSFMTS